MSEIKNRLKVLRTDRGLTQEELAKIINNELKENEKPVSKMVISNWENNKHTIKQDKAQKLADYFKVSIGYLLGYESDDVLLNTLSKKISSLSPEEFVEYTQSDEYSDEKKLFDHLFTKLQDFNEKSMRGRKIKDIIGLLKGLDLDDLNLINGFVERLYFSDYSLDDNDILDNKRKQLYDELKV